jgi:hypothetical protein
MGASEVIAEPWNLGPILLFGSPNPGWQEPVVLPVGWILEPTAQRQCRGFPSYR